MAGTAVAESSRIRGSEAVCPRERVIRARQKQRAKSQRDGDAAEEAGAAAAEVAGDATELSEARSVADARGRRQNGWGTSFRIRENQPAANGPGSDKGNVHVSARQGEAEGGRTA